MKPLEWIASSKRDLRAMPDSVQDNVGFALFQAQLGEKHDDAKPLKGFKGSGVLEIVDNFDGDTYRAVYTVRCHVPRAEATGLVVALSYILH
jgi:phage-related protein